MKFKWTVTASNAKGDYFEKNFKDEALADICHNQLYNEVDDRGLWKWGEIRTWNNEYNRDDTITGWFMDREGMVPNCIAEV